MSWRGDEMGLKGRQVRWLLEQRESNKEQDEHSGEGGLWKTRSPGTPPGHP